MSDIWPPRDFSIADGYYSQTFYQRRRGQTTYSWVDEYKNRPTQSGWTSRLGANTPGYTLASETGQLPMNRLDFDEYRWFGASGKTVKLTESFMGYDTLTISEGNGMPNLNTAGIDFKDHLAIQYSNLENKIQQQVLLNLKGSDINLAQAIAERSMTAKTIATAIARIAKARTALSKGKFMDAAQALGLTLTKGLSKRERAWRQSGSLARGWLELQYGWKPLVNDIYGACAFLRKSHNETGYMVFHSRGSLNGSWQTISDFTDMHLVENTTCNVTKKITLKVSRKTPLLASLSSLGITNPASIAWELTPWSYVVDWALPIGSFISQLDASLGYTFVGACVTTYKKQTYDAIASNPVVMPPNYVVFDVDKRQHAEQVDVTRLGYANFASLLSLPYFKSPISATHVANALALLRGLRR